MSALADRRSTPAFATRPDSMLRKIWGTLCFVARWPLRVHANRQLLGQMSGMSDYELSDIGVTRGDLNDSSALPLHSEVGAFLAKRASERRRGRR
jgi:uncharacterized protein YjiS (DUF1127 family)